MASLDLLQKSALMEILAKFGLKLNRNLKNIFAMNVAMLSLLQFCIMQCYIDMI